MRTKCNGALSIEQAEILRILLDLGVVLRNRVTIRHTSLPLF